MPSILNSWIHGCHSNCLFHSSIDSVALGKDTNFGEERRREETDAITNIFLRTP
jgi:hypothetical protein